MLLFDALDPKSIGLRCGFHVFFSLFVHNCFQSLSVIFTLTVQRLLRINISIGKIWRKNMKVFIYKKKKMRYHAKFNAKNAYSTLVSLPPAKHLFQQEL